MTDSMKQSGFRGVFPYLPSPVDSGGRVMEGELAALVEHLVAKGVHGLTPLGSTGEFPYLDDEQKAAVIRTVVSAAAGRVPVVAGVAATTVRAGVEQTRRAAGEGADGILAVLEAYFPVNETGVEEYFTAVAAAAGTLPVVLYTNPTFQRSDLSIDSIVRLSKVENIRYLKDASPNTGRLLSIMNRAGNLGIFSASAHIPVSVMLLGGLGWMAGPACVAPAASVRLYDLARAGDWPAAVALQKRLWKLNEIFARYSLASCIKAALNIQGFTMGEPLRPQQPLGEDAKKHIKSVLEELEDVL